MPIQLPISPNSAFSKMRAKVVFADDTPRLRKVPTTDILSVIILSETETVTKITRSIHSAKSIRNTLEILFMEFSRSLSSRKFVTSAVGYFSLKKFSASLIRLSSLTSTITEVISATPPRVISPISSMLMTMVLSSMAKIPCFSSRLPTVNSTGISLSPWRTILSPTSKPNSSAKALPMPTFLLPITISSRMTPIFLPSSGSTAITIA